MNATTDRLAGRVSFRLTHNGQELPLGTLAVRVYRTPEGKFKAVAGALKGADGDAMNTAFAAPAAIAQQAQRHVEGWAADGRKWEVRWNEETCLQTVITDSTL